MNLKDVKPGKVYWFTYGTSGVYLGRCVSVGDEKAVLRLTHHQSPWVMDTPFAREAEDIVSEQVDVVEESSAVEDSQHRSVGPRRINLDDGKKAVPKPARRWWEIWRTN